MSWVGGYKETANVIRKEKRECDEKRKEGERKGKRIGHEARERLEGEEKKMIELE